MTLFKITCDTCRTSLNVRQKSAIGQILACPKCGSMVQVQAPEGWENEANKVSETSEKGRPFIKPVPDPNLSETVASISGSVSDGLPKQDDPEKTNQTSKSNDLRWQGIQTDSSSPPASPPAENTTTTKRKPDLPDDQWDSNRARQRRKVLLAFTSSAGILVFGIAAIIFAILQFTGGNNDDPSHIQSGVAQAETNKPDSSDTDNDVSQKGNKSDQNPDAKRNSPTPSDNGTSSNKSTTGQANKLKDTPKEIPEPSEPSKQQPVENKKKNQKTGKSNQSKKNENDTTDTPPDFNPASDDVNTEALPDFFREMDEFAISFDQDEPLLRLREAFTEKDLPGSYGLSRYFISKSLKRIPNPDLSLNVPLAGVNFEQTTLLEFLDFFYDITGVPVSVDVTPSLLAGIRLDQKFDFSAASKTTRETLEDLATKLGLQLVKGDHSLVLTVKKRDSLQETTYPVGDIAATDSDRKNLIVLLETYIDQKSWSSHGGIGIAAVNNEKREILIKHYGWAHVRVQELLRHIRIRQGLSAKISNPNFPDSKHRLKLVSTLETQKVTLLHADPISLSKLSAQLASEFDIHLFINWEATGDRLRPSGNLPLAVDDVEFGNFIRELSEGAKLELVWHSPRVVELTTSFGASSNLTFESYDISQSTSKSFAAEKLLAALRNLLASNGLADFQRAAIGLDPQDQNSIYAVLPQSAHRNVLKILQSAETAIGKK